MPDVFVYDAVRTPFGRFGGALAGTRPDDLAALVVGGLLERAPGPGPRADRRGAARQRQRRRRGQPQRRPDGGAAGGAAGLRARVDGQPALRLLPGRHHRRRPAGRARRDRRRRGRRGRVDVARALGAAQAGAAVPGRQRRAGVDHARLAAGQPRDARRLDGLARRGDRAAARPRGRRHREDQDAFALRSHQLAGAGVGQRLLRRPGGRRPRGRPGPRRVDPRRHHRRASWPASSPCSAPTAPSPPATPRPLNDGASAALLGSASAAGLGDPLARVAGWGAAANEPQFFGFAPVEAADRALPAPASAGTTSAPSSSTRRSPPSRSPAYGAWGIDPEIVNAHGGAIAIGHPLGASGTRVLGTLARSLAASGERWGVAAICIGVGQGLAVVLENLHPTAAVR